MDSPSGSTTSSTFNASPQNLLDLPPELLDTILENMSYDQISNLRLVGDVALDSFGDSYLHVFSFTTGVSSF